MVFSLFAATSRSFPVLWLLTAPLRTPASVTPALQLAVRGGEDSVRMGLQDSPLKRDNINQRFVAGKDIKGRMLTAFVPLNINTAL